MIIPNSKPTETTVRESEIYMLTIMHYVDDKYKSNLQIEFSGRHSDRDLRAHIADTYEKGKEWQKSFGLNEFWKVENKVSHNHIVVIQKIRKHEKITKTLVEDSLLY